MAQPTSKKNYRTEKIDSDFVREMRELAKFRYMKNLAKQEPKLTKMTRLLRRTDGYKQSLFELKTKPEREDND